MKMLIPFTLIVSVAIVQPVNASEIIPAMERAENPIQLMEQLLCPSGIFNANEARRFLFQLKREVKQQHGIELDLNLVVDEAIRTMVQMGKFSQEEIEIARGFYSQLIQENDGARSLNSRKSEKKKKKHKKEKKNHKPELVLPDNMALGWMCILGGALLCIIPSGLTQSLGIGFITGGVIAIGQGAAQGEKPYYLDPETGQKTPVGQPNSGPSIGIGQPF